MRINSKLRLLAGAIGGMLIVFAIAAGVEARSEAPPAEQIVRTEKAMAVPSGEGEVVAMCKDEIVQTEFAANLYHYLPEGEEGEEVLRSLERDTPEEVLSEYLEKWQTFSDPKAAVVDIEDPRWAQAWAEYVEEYRSPAADFTPKLFTVKRVEGDLISFTVPRPEAAAGEGGLDPADWAAARVEVEVGPYGGYRFFSARVCASMILAPGYQEASPENLMDESMWEFDETELDNEDELAEIIRQAESGEPGHDDHTHDHSDTKANDNQEVSR